MSLHGLTRHVDQSPAWRALDVLKWSIATKLMNGPLRDMDFIGIIGSLEDLQMRRDALLIEEKRS